MTLRHIPIHALVLLTLVLSVDVHARALLQQPSTVFNGNIALQLVHDDAGQQYTLDFFSGNQTEVRQVLDVPDMPPDGPPSSFYTGTLPHTHMRYCQA